MNITITKYRPDGMPFKQVFVDFEDDTLFEADEDELDPSNEEFFSACPCDGCPQREEDGRPSNGDELCGQMSIDKFKFEAHNPDEYTISIDIGNENPETLTVKDLERITEMLAKTGLSAEILLK